jgi:cell division septum initiation protein DivIVA
MNKPIGPDETPEEIGDLLREIFDLAEQAAATISDDQIEQRLAQLLGHDPGHDEDPWASRYYLFGDNWVPVVDTTYTNLDSDLPYIHISSWAPVGHSCHAGLEDYVDEQLDRANEIKANARAEAAKIVEAAEEKAAQILEDAKRLARLEAFVSNDDPDTCDTPIFEAMQAQRRWLEEHQHDKGACADLVTLYCEPGTGRSPWSPAGATSGAGHPGSRHAGSPIAGGGSLSGLAWGARR